MKVIIRTNGFHNDSEHAVLQTQGLTCIRGVDWPLFNFFGHVVEVKGTLSIQSIKTFLPNAISVHPVNTFTIPPSPKGATQNQSTGIDVRGNTIQPLATTVTINDSWRELGMQKVWADSDYDGGAGDNIRIKIGHCDTGIDEAHTGYWPFRDGAQLANPGTPSLPNRIQDRMDMFPGELPYHSHGTWTAEIEAGSPRPDGTYKGAAYRAWLYDGRALGTNGEGDTLTVTDVLHWLGTKGVDVVNLSLGGSRDAVMDAAVESLWALGIVCCIATGNSGHFPPPCDGTILSPADSDDNLCFGASSIDEQDSQGGKQWYIQTWVDRNPRYDGSNQEFYMVAPGLYLVPGYGDNPNSGTSFAAPHGTGAVAAILHKIMRTFPNLTKIDRAKLVRQLMIGNAVSLGYESSGHYNASESYCIQGYGRIAVDQAYAAVGGTPPSTRKMNPCKSTTTTVTVSPSTTPPSDREDGVLVGGPDGNKYKSGDTIKGTFILRFNSDNAPHANVSVIVHLGDSEQTVTTDATGTATASFTAPTVPANADYDCWAEFLGDD